MWFPVAIPKINWGYHQLPTLIKNNSVSNWVSISQPLDIRPAVKNQYRQST